jgi:hypothetical protein
MMLFSNQVIAQSPISEYFVWPPHPHHNCINDGAMMLTGAILNTLSEAVIAILPIIAVFRLGVDPLQRKSAISLLSLGFLVTLTGCFRTFFVWKSTVTYDMAWWSTPHWICSEVEIDLALVGDIRSALCAFAHISNTPLTRL